MVKKHVFLLLVLSSLLMLLAFYSFSREVKRGALKQADFNVTVRLQDHMPVKLDEMWEDVAFVVSPGPSIVFIGLLTIVALVDMKNKKIRLRALLIPLLFAALIMGELYGKSVVHHPSPPFFMLKHPTTIFPQFYVNEQYSYPSGHTARAVFLGFAFYSAFGIWHSALRKKLKIVLALGIIAYIAMVAIGRIYLGHHWLSDVLGGLLLGSGMASLYGIITL